jgi:hypothetical protein
MSKNHTTEKGHLIGFFGCIVLFVLCPFFLVGIASLQHGHTGLEILLLMIFILVWGFFYGFCLALAGCFDEKQ